MATPQTPPASRATGTMFVRQSSGLVREISGQDALIGSLVCFNLAIAAITLLALPYTFPGANMPIAVLLALIPATLLGGVYVLFGVVMPRSGGDYVYISRAIHPSIGLAANMSATAWNLIILGVYANWVSTIGLSGLFASIGITRGSSPWNGLATTLGQPWPAVIVGTVVIALMTAVLINLRFALRAQKVLFYLGLLGIAVAIVVVGITGHSAFVSGVNRLATYSQIMSDAQKAGYAPPSSWMDPKQTILGVALLSLSTLFVMYAAYTGGEVRNFKRSLPFSIFGTVAVGGGVFFLMAVVAALTWGHDFLASIFTLWYGAPALYPFAAGPTFSFLASIGNSNVVLAVLMNLAFVFIPAASMIFTAIVATRCLFAWSFDRLLPSAVANVNERTHSPLVATLITAVVAEIALIAYTFFGGVSFLGGATLGWISAFATTSLAGIVFPYLRRSMYSTSPIQRSVLNIPLITLVGAASFAFLAVMIYAFFTNPVFGANSGKDLLFFAGFWVIGFVMYWFVRAIRLRQGVPFDAALAELPPE